MPAGESKKPFPVHDSGVTRKHFRELQLRATREGRGKEFLAAYQRIRQRLQTDPLDYGEPLYTLPHMKLQMRRCSVLPLIVDYGVSVEHHMVFIKSVHLMPL